VPVEELLTELTPDNTSPLLPPDWTVPAELSTSVQGLPKIVCICGSARFRHEMAEANRKLTLAGCIVVAPAVFQHRGDAITSQTGFSAVSIGRTLGLSPPGIVLVF